MIIWENKSWQSKNYYGSIYKILRGGGNIMKSIKEQVQKISQLNRVLLLLAELI